MAISWAKAPKDPEDVADYTINWAAELGVLTISSSVYSVVDGDVVIDDQDNDNTTATVRLSAGTVAQSPAILNNHIVLSDGQERDVNAQLPIKERIVK